MTVAVGCSSTSKSSSSSSSARAASTTVAPPTSVASSTSADAFGTPNPVTGQPVPVGVISNGDTASTSNQIEIDVANAEVKWLNDRKGGFGGRPIKLVTCTDGGDPGKAGDCANQMISDGVVAVVIGSSQVIDNEWKPLHDAHIPVVTYSDSGNLLQDAATTFGIGSGPGAVVIVPEAAAKAQNKTKISAMVIDVPAATDLYVAAVPGLKAEGITLNMIRIPLGTPDMTPQAQQIVSGGDPGIVNVLGNDTFCIAAFKALQAVGYTGTITTAGPCISDATRKAVPASVLKGMQLSFQAPVSDTASPSYQLYSNVINTYGGGKIDISRSTGWDMWITLNGLFFGVKGISGDITPATVASTLHGMTWTELPGAGGLHYRCNGKADPANPSLCMRGTLVSSLDATGNPTTYTAAGDTQIPD
jgi:branched-chain amino acid transport system substrate-binding protein